MRRTVISALVAIAVFLMVFVSSRRQTAQEQTKGGKFVGILNKVMFADGRVLSTERSNGVVSDLYVK
jgi:hypothetical protein